MHTLAIPSIDPSEYLFVDGNTVKTDSLKVAKAFNKRHDDVLRKIKSLDCSEKFTARNFAVSEYHTPPDAASLSTQ